VFLVSEGFCPWDRVWPSYSDYALSGAVGHEVAVRVRVRVEGGCAGDLV